MDARLQRRIQRYGWDKAAAHYEQVLTEPDIVILEGLNVLQTGVSARHEARFVSDWFDFSIYVDAEEADIEQWYVDRFFALRETDRPRTQAARTMSGWARKMRRDARSIASSSGGWPSSGAT